MPNLLTIPAGAPVARHAAMHVLASVPAHVRHRALILVPNRRSCAVMRTALAQELHGQTALLPTILPLAEGDAVLLHLLGAAAVPVLTAIPSAMDPAQQRYLLAEQIRAFERRRMGGVTLHYALTLAETLMALQEQCIRHGVSLTQEALRPLMHADFATHWKQALLFLSILTDSWPAIEVELGQTTQAAREVALTRALTQHLAAHPCADPVVVVGSTASQPATAELMRVIAQMPHGQVILPGVDPTMPVAEWAAIAPGHPLYHVKAWLDRWPMSAAQVTPLAEPCAPLWLQALAPMAFFGAQREEGTTAASAPRLSIIPCAHGQEEVRVISLLLREALESPTTRVALITPDEGLMAQVAAHMKRYGLTLDRLHSGTLATTEVGSLWAGLVAAITTPARLLPLRTLLHHPLLGVEADLLAGLARSWHGVNRSRAGQLPRHDASLRAHAQYAALAQLVADLHGLSTATLTIHGWVEACRALLAPWVGESGQGQAMMEEQLALLAYAERLGTLEAEDFAALLEERLCTPWREVGVRTEPRIAMLTPVEARLMAFDRVILANMQERLWPGASTPNPWLNRTAQAALGLPTAEESISLMAHDVLMLASAGEVFLTYPLRDQGAPTTRSRFIERLVTLRALQGLQEKEIVAERYLAWAAAREASEDYVPEGEIFPKPEAHQRPRRLPVTDIDTLFTDPFAIYAKHVLGLRKLEAMDAAPEASDFGSLAHKAIEALTQHWNHAAQPATQAELDHIANHALRDFSERPNVAIFWRTRLLNGLHYVNQLEQQRRVEPLKVATETPIEAEIIDGVTLHGRIDRVEWRGARATLIDHKTGDIPSEKKILDGRALQLLVYAMLQEKTGATAEAIEYWALPRLGEVGQQRHVDTPASLLEPLKARLGEALQCLLDPATPLIANTGEAPFGDDYAGLSRYDEWAG